MYTQFMISKKNGKSRIISAPNKKLRNIQRKLAYVLSLMYKPKVCAYGFIDKKDIIGNASNHLRKKEILNIDLKDFFYQIHIGRIIGMLEKKPYCVGHEAAVTIAQLCCYNGKVPQGAPTSPIISNMICAPLDNALIALAKKYKIQYTRYADDLTFSTHRDCLPPSIIKNVNGNKTIGYELKEILCKHNFIVNPEKINCRLFFQRQEVTGLVVNQKINVKREYIKELRAILYNCINKGTFATAKNFLIKRYGESVFSKVDLNNEEKVSSLFQASICGRIRYIGHVKGKNDLSYLSLANKANDVFNNEIFDVSELKSINDLLSENVFIIESKEDQGSCFVLKGYGLITCKHVITNDSIAYKIYTEKSYSTKISECQILPCCMIKAQDHDIDYCLFDQNNSLPKGFEVDPDSKIQIGDTVIIAGYPDYIENDSINIQTCQITRRVNNFLGSPLYTVSGRITHGYSGGVVLNMQRKVIGLIKGGVVSENEADKNDRQGFVPINIIMKDILKKLENTN